MLTLTVGEWESILVAKTPKKDSDHSDIVDGTAADIVVYAMDTEEFVRIELPIDAEADEEVQVTRDR